MDYGLLDRDGSEIPLSLPCPSLYPYCYVGGKMKALAVGLVIIVALLLVAAFAPYIIPLGLICLVAWLIGKTLGF